MKMGGRGGGVMAGLLKASLDSQSVGVIQPWLVKDVARGP